MGSLLPYINQKYKNAYFSEMIYARNNADTIIYDWNQRGARCIYYHYIYWTPTNSGTVFKFFDQFGNVLFETVDLYSLPNSAPLELVKDGSKIKVTCSLAGINFYIAYQYIG